MCLGPVRRTAVLPSSIPLPRDTVEIYLAEGGVSRRLCGRYTDLRGKEVGQSFGLERWDGTRVGTQVDPVPVPLFLRFLESRLLRGHLSSFGMGPSANHRVSSVCHL